MRQAIQYISLMLLTMVVAISCDSMTGSNSGINQNSGVLSNSSAIGAEANSTIIVSGDTFEPTEYSGWLFNRDLTTQSPYIFTTDEASIGDGSLYVEPITNSINGNSDKFIGELFLDGAIADIESISYDFLIGNGGEAADANQFYLNVYANFGESAFDKYYDCKYDVVPSSGATSDWTTVTFDLTQSYPVTERSDSPYTCPSIPADMETLSAGSTIRMVALNVGDTGTSGSDQDLDGYYDNVVVTEVEDVITYDFEPPVLNPQTKNECKKGGWEEFGFKNQGQCVRYVNTGKDSR